MIKPELRRLSSPDLPGYPRQVPSSTEAFRFVLDAEIGPAGSHGSDLFTAIVQSPAHPNELAPGEQCRWVGSRLIIARFDVDLIERAWLALCESAAADTWEETARKLAQHTHWEFDGYDRS